MAKDKGGHGSESAERRRTNANMARTPMSKTQTKLRRAWNVKTSGRTHGPANEWKSPKNTTANYGRAMRAHKLITKLKNK